MKAYGMSAGDYPCCCPGHDKFSLECYNNRRSKKAHTEMTKKLHRRGRKRARLETQEEATNIRGFAYNTIIIDEIGSQ